MSRQNETQSGSQTRFELDCELIFADEIEGKATFEPGKSAIGETKMSVTFAKLLYVDQTLRLTVKGENLSGVKLTQCTFDFSFDFGGTRTKVIKNNANILVLEQPMPNFSATVPEYGCQIRIQVESGHAEYLLTEFDGIEKRSVNELAKDDDVLLVLDAAFKRAVDLICINENPMNVPLICNLRVLSHLLLDESDYSKLLNMLSDGEKLKIDDAKVDSLDDLVKIMSEKLTSPVQLKKKRSAMEKAAIMMGSVVLTAAAVTGGIFAAGASSAGFVAAGEVVAGAAVAGAADEKVAKAIVVGVASAAIAVSESTFDSFQNKTLKKANYLAILDYLIEQLKSRTERSVVESLESLLTSEKVYKKEKALLMMFSDDCEDLHDNFKGCQLEECIPESKDLLVQRILSVKQVHKIRDILANQCFIGIVGPQNAGKSSLIKYIWSCDVVVGQLKHTTETAAFQVTDKVMVIDYPGSTSLDDYRKAFSRSGSMNNILVAVIQYQGAPDQITCNSLQEIYTTVQKSKGMKVILCFNQCGKSYDELIEENVTINDMKNRYVEQLNRYLNVANGPSGSENDLKFCKEDICFTDWKATTEQRKFGILGIKEIKTRIRKTLKELNLINNDELKAAIPY